MSNTTRDTQFLESAERTVKEIEAILYPKISHAEYFDVRKAVIELVAQYAYDIAAHTIFEQGYGLDRLSTEWVWERIKDIPDLPHEWWKKYERER